MQKFLEAKDNFLNKIVDFFLIFYYKPKNFFFKINYNLKKFWQRGKYGVALSDSWDIDKWFSSVIPHLIRNLKENLHGCPNRFCYNENGEEISLEEAMEKWRNILERIAFCFEESNEEKSTYAELVDIGVEEKWIETERAHFKYRNNMKNEAFDLIKEYYWDLWD